MKCKECKYYNIPNSAGDFCPFSACCSDSPLIIKSYFKPREPEFDIKSILYEGCPLVCGDNLGEYISEHDGYYYISGKGNSNNPRLPTPREIGPNIKVPHHYSLGKPEGIEKYDNVAIWTEDGVNTILKRGDYWDWDIDDYSAITAWMLLE